MHQHFDYLNGQLILAKTRPDKCLEISLAFTDVRPITNKTCRIVCTASPTGVSSLRKAGLEYHFTPYSSPGSAEHISVAEQSYKAGCAESDLPELLKLHN